MKKKLLYSGLYFSEGAPIGFIWWCLTSILATNGVSNAQIATITAMATLPWSFKFVLAPIIEVLSRKGLGLKWQLFSYQLLMGASALSFSSYIEAADYNSLTWIIFFHSLMSASQDICIDSLAIKNISESELGSINGFMQAGMLLGRSLFGGAGIYLFHLYGLNTLVYLLVTCIWLSLIASLFIEEKKTEIVGDTLTKYFSEVYGLLKSKNLWTLMSIAFLASLSFEGIAGLASATLVKKSISSEWRSWIYALGVPLLMTIGSLLGGYTSDKKGKEQVLTWAIIATAASSIILAFLFDKSQMHLAIISVLLLFYLCIGFLTSSLYAFLMSKTSKMLAAFEFSILMAMTNLCESFSTYTVGQFLDAHGFLPVIIIFAGLSVLGTWLLKKNRGFNA